MTASRTKKMFDVLAVDDDQKTLDAIRLILADQYHFLTATNSDEALQLIAKKKVDLVFLDIHMPGGMDGMEVL